MNKLFILGCMLLGSCTQLLFPQADQFNGRAFVTSYTEHDTQCEQKFIKLEHRFTDLGARVFIQLVIDQDTTTLQLNRINTHTYQGTANDQYEVVFPSKREQKEGTILLIREEFLTRVIASKCFNL